ncbi:1-phosphofructokinase [Aeromicrobium sp. A1-2]|uniref:1-phosphofructokinase family hexose kinase n=1 Tax=Aeromicrobium sp. A1-2 TaxID=2107713 RepID=UPI000E538D40|nr:1-phosphofructokinase family hexose kinase [Aeromicrobium sp. A1-2]AXT84474.1 1-phosphofructokinase [Aeromicrobium sp. A1-2]
MIVTLTPNPSIDRTIGLGGPLDRGGVMRSVSAADQAGGKGVNVAQVVRAAGQLAVAVLPGDHDDPLMTRLRELGLTHRAVPTGVAARVNLTLAEPDGVTTKINAPGSPLSPKQLERLVREVAREAVGARWAVLSGSLPPGVDAGWYADVVEAVHGDGLQIAVDTSGTSLRKTLDRAAERIDLIKPNSDELGELLDVPASLFEGDPQTAYETARPLLDRGVGEILLTLGGQGALLMSLEGLWSAPAPTITARSTVGAGDSALAGYLVGALDGAGPADRLALAIAYGSAAASLPGSTMPTPADLPPLPQVVRL